MIKLPDYDISALSQFVVDFLEELADKIYFDHDGGFDEDFTKEGCIYKVDTLLEIINPQLTEDIKVLQRVKKVLEV